MAADPVPRKRKGVRLWCNLHRMKAFLLPLAIVLFVSASLRAQVTLNGFGAPIIEAAPLDGDWRAHLGGGAALLVNGSFYAGLYATGMLGTIDRTLYNPLISDSVVFPLNFIQGGLWTGYIINKENRLQVTVNAKAGVGRISTSVDCNCGPDRIFLVSPYLGLQYAVSELIRIEFEGGYRIVGSDNDLDLFGDTNLSAPFVGLNVKFGGFE